MATTTTAADGTVAASKVAVRGRLVKLLFHRRTDRGMTLIPEQSRCVRAGEVHELVTTDHTGLGPASRVQRVGFLGFVEIGNAGVLDVGDRVLVGGRQVGVVAGFDACHFPNHYNIVVAAPRLLTAADLDLDPGQAIDFGPGAVPPDGPPRSRGPDTVIVGYGHAARSFHVPAVLDLAASGRASGRIRVVDPALGPADPGLPAGAVAVRRLADVAGARDAVVHVCTGPDSHADVVLAAYRLGFRRFVVEKPMAVSVADGRRLVALAEEGDAEILVVSNWAASALTDEIRRVLRARAGTPPSRIVLTQVKPRLERTLDSDTHRSAFDVEMPHLVALAQRLADGPLEVEAASHADLFLGGRWFPEMGAATITLRTPDGVPVFLRSDLTTPWRERSTRVEWADGSRLVGFHPCDSADRYAQLFTWASDSEHAVRRFLHDDTVRRLLQAAYAHFGGTGPKPSNDVRFGAATTAIIETARAASILLEHRPEHVVEVAHAV